MSGDDHIGLVMLVFWVMGLHFYIAKLGDRIKKLESRDDQPR